MDYRALDLQRIFLGALLVADTVGLMTDGDVATFYSDIKAILTEYHIVP